LAKQSKPSDRASRPHFDLVVEKDLEIPMRDGARLRADVFVRNPRTLPAIIKPRLYRRTSSGAAAGPRGEAERVHELGDGEPAVVGSAGYTSCARRPGLGQSRAHDPWSLRKRADFYDGDRMDGKQSWCNGRVGMNGISYYAMTQWLVAD